MIKIENINKFPIQVMIRSKKTVSYKDSQGKVRGNGSRNFTTKIIPGIGAGMNTYSIEDEAITPQIEELANRKLLKLHKI